MRLLHFRRTFVAKMFAIHGKVEILKHDGRSLGAYARHYYELFQLAGQEDVVSMLQSDEYGTIKPDYDTISRTHFERSYLPPEKVSFDNSDALFPPADLAKKISAEYERQCQLLCYGPYPHLAGGSGQAAFAAQAALRQVSRMDCQFELHSDAGNASMRDDGSRTRGLCRDSGDGNRNL